MGNDTEGFVLVEYIGKRKPRFDNILGTKRTWSGPGAVVEVPYMEAPHYLAHSSSFQRVTREELDARTQASAEVEVTIEGLDEQLRQMPLDSLHDLNERICDLIETREAELAERARQASEDSSKSAQKASVAVGTVTDEAGRAKAAEQIKQVADAIGELDPNDKELFAQGGPHTGKPKVGPLSQALGRKVTQEEVNAAMELRASVG